MTTADKADRHLLYQEAVQDVVAEIDFVATTYHSLTGRSAESLREDFCGTANTSCEWVRRGRKHLATGVDLDAEVLEWGGINNLGALNSDQQSRIDLCRRDVRSISQRKFQIILAMNFSYYLLMEREELVDYFASVKASLSPDGIFFLDAYGGYDAPREIEEPRECEGFSYVWDQADFDPVSGKMQCHIHFKFPDGSELSPAFSYYWRLWTLPEIRECLSAAGFDEIQVYWEGTDEESGEGDGVFSPCDRGDADPGWICYLTAR